MAEKTRNEAYEGPSKTRRKRDAEALQAIGERLVDLRPSQLAQIPLEDALREAVQAAQRIHARGGRRRQLQWIGKLMRAADADAISQALAGLDAVRRRDAERLHELEEWRARLLTGAAGALEALVAEHPGVDRDTVAGLVRRATCRGGTRALFRYLDGAIQPRPGPRDEPEPPVEPASAGTVGPDPDPDP